MALNRGDLLSLRDDLHVWRPWNLEPIWATVVCVALAQLGRLEIGYAGEGQLDAMTLDRLRSKSVEELQSFSHVAPPKALPVNALKEAARLLGLAPGVIGAEGVKNDGVVGELVAAANQLADRVVRARAAVGDRAMFWGTLLIEHPERREQQLARLQGVLDNLRARTTVGRMNKLDLTAPDMAAAQEAKAELDHVEAVLHARDSLSSLVAYLDKAAGCFPGESGLVQDATALRGEILEALHASQIDGRAIAELRRRAEDLHDAFAAEAVRAHVRDRLDRAGDARKRELLEGETLGRLKAISRIALLPREVLQALLEELSEIESCPDFDEELLRHDVVCQRCGYQPSAGAGRNAGQALAELEGELEKLLAEWEAALADALAEQDVRTQIGLLEKAEQEVVSPLLDDRRLPQPATPRFVEIVNRLVEGFDVRRVSRQQLWVALFPEASPASIDLLRRRFERFIAELGGGGREEAIKIVPTGEHERT
jgi:Family of unknown function (DUF6079)